MLVTKTSLLLAALSGYAVAEEIMVMVGDGGLTFDPPSINATTDDWVVFHFASDGHDVAQGSFANPCEPSDGGFFSGSVSKDKTFRVKIEDEDPIWVYCSVGQHCQNGMVGAINAPSSGENTLEAYEQGASNSDSSVTPENVRGGEVSENGSGHGDSPTGTGSDASSPTETDAPDAAPGALLTRETIVLCMLAVGGSWFGLM